MEDTWTSRDLPVLEAIVRLLDQGAYMVTVRELAGDTGLDPASIDRAITALEGQYVVEYEQFATAGDPNSWRVRQVTAEARRAVGQWPSPEGLVDALAEAFGSAAEQEPDSEKKSRLRQVGSFLSGTGRDVATEVVSKVILRSAGMG
jgi:DNA-binding MarR family transcriptional regulator